MKTSDETVNVSEGEAAAVVDTDRAIPIHQAIAAAPMYEFTYNVTYFPWEMMSERQATGKCAFDARASVHAEQVYCLSLVGHPVLQGIQPMLVTAGGESLVERCEQLKNILACAWFAQKERLSCYVLPKVSAADAYRVLKAEVSAVLAPYLQYTEQGSCATIRPDWTRLVTAIHSGGVGFHYGEELHLLAFKATPQLRVVYDQWRNDTMLYAAPSLTGKDDWVKLWRVCDRPINWNKDGGLDKEEA